VVMANFSSRTATSYVIGFPRAGAWQAHLSTDDTRYGSDFGGTGKEEVVTTARARDGLSQSGAVTVGPYSVVILSQ
jgi:1,4-alpha-glucan branching enzyme